MKASHTSSVPVPVSFVLRRAALAAGLAAAFFLLRDLAAAGVAVFGGEEVLRHHFAAWGGAPFRVGREALFVFLPFSFYFAYAVSEFISGNSNVHRYPFAANGLYLARRLVVFPAALFVAAYAVAVALPAARGGDGQFIIPFRDDVSSFAGFIGIWVGTACLAFCFWTGLARFLADWGVVATRAVRKRVSRMVLAGFAVTASGFAFAAAEFALSPADRPEPLEAMLALLREALF